MRRHERFTVDNSRGLSMRQCVAIGILFIVMLVTGHDLTYSAHSDEIKYMSSSQLVDLVVTGGSITRRVSFVVLLIGGVLVLAGAWNDGPRSSALRNNVVLACFVGFTFLSVSWSSDPGLTFRRASEYFIVCVGAAAAGRILGLRGIVWLGFLGSTGYLLIGLISEMVLGTFHPFSLDYRFCGTLHPNHQAWNCGLLLISGSALLPRIRRFWRPAYFMAMTLGVVCLFLTKSRTSLLCGVLALVYYWAGELRPKQLLATGTLLVGSLLAATFLPSKTVSQLDGMLLAGRDTDSYENFSGRLPLWNLAMEYVGERPLAGYGFNSFWTPDHIREVSAEVEWTVSHSHNDYIELMLGLGAIGLSLYLSQLCRTWWLLRRSYERTRNPFVRFYLALLVFYLACMFTEAIAFDVGLPTFCLLSMLWSRKQFAPVPAERMIPAPRPMQAYQ
jgi:exopolysaccharide production protein ExoQ